MLCGRCVSSPLLSILLCVGFRGYIVDVSLHGTSVEPDTDDIFTTYGAGVTPSDILSGKAQPPKEAALLYKTIRDIEDKFSAPAI
jgi:lipid-binding SYLF domain-containing protein